MDVTMAIHRSLRTFLAVLRFVVEINLWAMEVMQTLVSRMEQMMPSVGNVEPLQIPPPPTWELTQYAGPRPELLQELANASSSSGATYMDVLPTGFMKIRPPNEQDQKKKRTSSDLEEEWTAFEQEEVEEEDDADYDLEYMTKKTAMMLVKWRRVVAEFLWHQRMKKLPEFKELIDLMNAAKSDYKETVYPSNTKIKTFTQAKHIVTKMGDECTINFGRVVNGKTYREASEITSYSKWIKDHGSTPAAKSYIHYLELTHLLDMIEAKAGAPKRSGECYSLVSLSSLLRQQTA